MKSIVVLLLWTGFFVILSGTFYVWTNNFIIGSGIIGLGFFIGIIGAVINNNEIIDEEFKKHDW